MEERKEVKIRNEYEHTDYKRKAMNKMKRERPVKKLIFKL